MCEKSTASTRYYILPGAGCCAQKKHAQEHWLDNKDPDCWLTALILPIVPSFIHGINVSEDFCTAVMCKIRHALCFFNYCQIKTHTLFFQLLPN